MLLFFGSERRFPCTDRQEDLPHFGLNFTHEWRDANQVGLYQKYADDLAVLVKPRSGAEEPRVANRTSVTITAQPV